MNLTYQAKDAAEFKELCHWLKENGFYKNGGFPSVKKDEVVSDKTWEEKWKALTGELRMRITSQEQVAMGAQNLTREDIARQRCEALDQPKDDSDVVAKAPDVL